MMFVQLLHNFALLNVAVPHLYSVEKVWQETLDLGLHNSGDLVDVKVWDSDSGWELTDTLLYNTTIRVPWCSAFHAEAVTADCDNEGYTYECDTQVHSECSFSRSIV